jgi:hypothetical protein
MASRQGQARAETVANAPHIPAKRRSVNSSLTQNIKLPLFVKAFA